MKGKEKYFELYVLENKQWNIVRVGYSFNDLMAMGERSGRPYKIVPKKRKLVKVGN
jgi:hypothetical protein